MSYGQNNWQLIRGHYQRFTAAIMASPSNEWAIDAYAWNGFVHLTPIETWLWHDIRAVDLVLYPQFPVGNMFVDFANPKAKVAIECDGAEFHKDKAKDAARDKRLADAGWAVYRISGKDCRDGVGMEKESQSAARKFINCVASRHDIQRP